LLSVSQLRSHHSIELLQKKALVAAKARVSLYPNLIRNRMVYMSYYPYKYLTSEKANNMKKLTLSVLATAIMTNTLPSQVSAQAAIG
jgi:hypothetical protein